MKNKVYPSICILIALLIIGVGLTFGQTLIKRLIGVEDISLATGGTGVAETFTYTTPDGLVLTFTKPDATHLKFRQGMNSVAKSIEDLVNGAMNTYRLYSTFPALITQIAANQKTVEVWDTQAITADVTVPANVSVKMVYPGKFTVSTTKTLTINGTFDAGLYQTISCTGTGKVVFGAGSITGARPVWWGADNTGVVDSAAAINAAILSVKDYAKVPVKVGTGTFKLESPIVQYDGAPVICLSSKSTTFVPVGNISAFTQGEMLGGLNGLTLILKGFTIDYSTNANNSTMIKFENLNVQRCKMEDIYLIGNPAAEQIGIHFKMDAGGGGQVYYNVFEGIHMWNVCSPLGAFYVQCNKPGNSFNQNTFVKCKFGPDLGYKTGIRIEGGVQTLIDLCCFNKVISPVRPSPNYGTDFPIILGGIIDSSSTNTTLSTKITNCWFELHYADAISIYASGVAAGAWQVSQVSIDKCTGVSELEDVWTGILNRGYAATFIGANTLKVVGEDITADFKAGYKVYLNHGVDGWRTSTLSIDSTFGGGDTTITLTDAILTANLSTITLASDYNNSSPAIATIDKGNNIIIRELTPRLITVGPAGTLIKGISFGTCTLRNTGETTTVVANASVTAGSRVYLQATSVTAGAIVAEATGVCVKLADNVAGVSFTVTHKATPGAGCTFNYWMANP